MEKTHFYISLFLVFLTSLCKLEDYNYDDYEYCDEYNYNDNQNPDDYADDYTPCRGTQLGLNTRVLLPNNRKN